MFKACEIMSGLIFLMSGMLPPPAGIIADGAKDAGVPLALALLLPPLPPERWPSILFRSSPKRSTAVLRRSGFERRCCICAFMVFASMPSGIGALLSMASNSSGDILAMVSVASLSMSGFSVIFSAASAHCFEPGPTALGAGAEEEEDCCQAEATSCLGAGLLSMSFPSSMPFAFRSARSRLSSRPMAASLGAISAARRRSSTASPSSPLASRAEPRRNSALWLEGLILRASSLDSNALSYSLVFR
mmetsp:Transcript_906/g.2088  ORF Transcript_906/g.2088 Transcript_906/m.2088 type:complete len:246 (-) Transcript_906:35-772(-)